MSSVRFLAVGDLMADVVAHGKGHSALIELAPGGSALNAALAAVGLGADTGVAGRIGDDPAGRMLVAELEHAGVRTEVGVDPEAPTGTVLVVDGETRADRGANARFAPEHLPMLEADAILVSGYLEEDTVRAALERARADWVALDAGRLESLPETAPVVVANEPSARRLTGRDPEQAAAQLGAGRTAACVTLGARGALAAWNGRVERVESPATAPGDPFGAGDAFAAGFLVELARGATVPEALAAGCRAGATATRARP